MSDDIARVRALRLKAAAPALAQRGRILIEDALHVADVPAARGGRTLFLRRLHLGRVDASASSAAIALRIEERIRSLAAQAVHAVSPQAEAAPAVFFSSPTEPLVTLGLLAATARALDAWYWPAVLPALKQPRPRNEVLRLVLLELAARPEAPVAMAQLARALVERHAAESLAAALRTEDGPVLASALGLARHTASTVSASRPSVENGLPDLPSEPAVENGLIDATSTVEGSARNRPASLPPPGARTALAAALRAWGPDDPRSLWLAAVLTAAWHPLPLPPARLTALAAALVAAERTPAATHLRDARPPDSTFASEPALSSSRLGEVASALPRASSSAKPENDAQTVAVPDVTRFAGLLFIVNALSRLRFERWLDAHPAAAECGFALRLLHELARVESCPEDDPILLCLALPEESAPVDARPLRAWHRTLRRWVKRHAGIGLPDLIVRSARVKATATHLELFLEPGSVDMRLRRCGLDFDPGWVPWLGRVVAFHYGAFG